MSPSDSDSLNAMTESQKYEPLLHVVLYQPEIPHNTGSVGRTCVAAGAKLWLVRPLGFRLDDYYLRRAGLDYWQHLEWEVVDDWAALVERAAATAGRGTSRKTADAQLSRRAVRCRRRAGVRQRIARPAAVADGRQPPSGYCAFRSARRPAA